MQHGQKGLNEMWYSSTMITEVTPIFKCVSYLNDFKLANWPQHFAAIPRVGDYVQEVGGARMLKVGSITFTEVKEKGIFIPKVIIELYK
jgi:hypothetical protein